jgi:two-component system, OmpR family, sensor histidine kinase KdpD
MARQIRLQRPVGAYVAVPAAFAAMFAIGTVAAALHGRMTAAAVLAAVTVVVVAAAGVTEPRAAPVVGLLGWLTTVGFSRPPYAQLRMTGPVAARAAVVLAVACLAAAGIGALCRRLLPTLTGPSVTLVVVDYPAESPQVVRELETGSQEPDAQASLSVRRRVAAVVLAAIALPVLTAVLAAARPYLSLDDELLLYLVAVVAVAIVGGFWPAVSAAVAASLLLNWYFTPPLHTFTIDRPENLLALLLFVTVAVTVSSVVHLAARRAVQAARSASEAASLLALAQTVLSGADTPAAVLDHLVTTLGGRAELAEHVKGRWVSVAVSGDASPAAACLRIKARRNLVLDVAGQTSSAGRRLLEGFAAQAAAALDRERLRTQAAQAEALAEGNRMRTALLAAVSHDLRTPLASIKASVSTLRQQDVAWTEEDQAALLATTEESADRLDALIGNLLDMSRLATSSLQPFLRPTAVDEVAPVAAHGLDGAASLRMDVPDGLPLVQTDPGLLERVLANLFANALAYSPPGRPPALVARQAGDRVVLEVVDHGRGVPDELKDRIFEPFERIGGHGTPGVGLGLAVAKGFAEAMGASLHAADTEGGGLTMRITLPVAATPAGSPLLAGR